MCEYFFSCSFCVRMYYCTALSSFFDWIALYKFSLLLLSFILLFCWAGVILAQNCTQVHLRLAATSSFWPFMLIFTVMSIVLLVSIVFFLCRVPFHTPLLGVLILLVKSISSPLVPPMRTMLSRCMVYTISLLHIASASPLLQKPPSHAEKI